METRKRSFLRQSFPYLMQVMLSELIFNLLLPASLIFQFLSFSSLISLWLPA